jgi:hypothetical protein
MRKPPSSEGTGKAPFIHGIHGRYFWHRHLKMAFAIHELLQVDTCGRIRGEASLAATGLILEL